MQGLLQRVAQLLYLILPAYIANAAPVVASRLVKRRHPVDCGLNFIDGRRLLGDSKTWEGAAVGVAAGSLVGVAQWMLGDQKAVARAVALSFGAVAGDMIGSFIKRRLGFKPGAPLPLLDQLDFLLGALLIAEAAGLLALTPLDVAILCALTLVLHPLTNVAAYKFKLKRVPW